MTSVNTITKINPFAYATNNGSMIISPATTYTDSLFSYNPLPTLNYFPINTTATFDSNMYFGCMPNFSYTQFDVDSIVKTIINNGKSQTNPFSLLNFGQFKTQSTGIIAPKTTSTPSQPIQDNGKSDLKPGLFKGRLAGQEALVSRICRKYGVSPALVASIIGLESGWGTSNLAMHNNFGGYRAAGDLGKNEKGFGYFSTIEKGLEAMIKNLASYTKFRDVAKVDFNNLDNIGRHYCEGNAWSGKVRNMYNSRVKNYLA